MTKIKVWVEQDTFDPEGSAKSLIDQLQWCVDTYGDDVRIEQRNRQWEDGYYYAIEILVEETDAEYEHRVAHEKQTNKRIEEHERFELQRLLDKFGTGV
jgi:hypothetical protein